MRPTRSVPAGDGGRDGVAESTPRRERVMHRRRLVPAVHHAVAALLVAAPPPVVFPAGGLDQLLERRRVAFLQGMAGTLPAEEVDGRVAPRRGAELPLAKEECQEPLQRN